MDFFGAETTKQNKNRNKVENPYYSLMISTAQQKSGPPLSVGGGCGRTPAPSLRAIQSQKYERDLSHARAAISLSHLTLDRRVNAGV